MKRTSSIFILTTILVFLSCSSGGKGSQSINLKSLTEDEIIIGTGGGFSGFYDGIVIERGGDVFSWRAKTDTPDELIWMFTTTKDSVAFFFRYLDEIGFAEMKSASSGNMNSFIDLRKTQTKHRVVWEMDNPASGPTLSSFHTIVRKYFQRHSADQK